MSTYKTFETERLILKPTTVEDAAFILELMNTPKWHKYIGDRNVNTLEDAEAYILEKMKPQLVRLGYGNYTLIRKSDQTKIGTVGLYDREGMDGIDIGFGFLPAYEKKGYAYEAANKIKNVAFNDFGLELIKAITNKENVASQKLLEKLGLTQKGNIQLPNDDEALFLYEIEKPGK